MLFRTMRVMFNILTLFNHSVTLLMSKLNEEYMSRCLVMVVALVDTRGWYELM